MINQTGRYLTLLATSFQLEHKLKEGLERDHITVNQVCNKAITK